MKTETSPASDADRLAELRQREKQIIRHPTTESYLELADAYNALGMGKESDRLMQLAESFENSGRPPASGLLSGSANLVMLTEIIQILSRTKSSGDFVINAQAETFHLFFDHGQIISASSQTYPAGMPSFRMALRVTNGTYHFVQTPPTDVARLIKGDTEFLLLDAMQHEDLASAEKARA